MYALTNLEENQCVGLKNGHYCEYHFLMKRSGFFIEGYEMMPSDFQDDSGKCEDFEILTYFCTP